MTKFLCTCCGEELDCDGFPSGPFCEGCEEKKVVREFEDLSVSESNDVNDVKHVVKNKVSSQ